MEIRVLKRTQIDILKWDDCIINSFNSLHYAMSWHLDIVSPDWNGIIYGDYEAVMPLPVKYKFGIPVILQPFLTQQLGIFNRKNINAHIAGEFYKKLRTIFPVTYNINLKHDYVPGFNIKHLPNFELKLTEEFENLKEHYTNNTKRNIAKANKHLLKLKHIAVNELSLKFYFDNLRFPFSSKEKQLFTNILTKALNRNKGLWTAVTDKHDNILVIAFFIIHKDRITFIGSSSSKEGYEKSATFFLFDEIIKKYSNSKFILDFEGSQTEGVARFYKGYGGKVIHYGQFKNNASDILLFLKTRNFQYTLKLYL